MSVEVVRMKANRCAQGLKDAPANTVGTDGTDRVVYVRLQSGVLEINADGRLSAWSESDLTSYPFFPDPNIKIRIVIEK